MSEASTDAVSLHPVPARVSEIFDPSRWREVPGFPHAAVGAAPAASAVATGPSTGGGAEPALTDITYHRGCLRDASGAWLRDLPVVRVALNRPEVRNAFRPRTVDELYRVLDHARMSGDVGAVVLTGNGPSPRDGGWAFSSGGDQRIRGRDGYRYESEPAHSGGQAEDAATAGPYSHEADVAAARARVDTARAGRLHILEVQRLIRTMPKVVIAAVPGWAAGGGHSLNVVADLSLASIEHARFKQTDADVGSFDAGYGSALLARQVGDKRAREIFFLARTYDAATAERWGVVNEAVPHAELEERALEWAAIVAGKSPQAIRMLKLAFNLADDGLAGQQVFAGEATRLAYMTDEALEGRDAFLERRDPDWSPFPYYF
ncbi:1,4-dihydroxy-2-naphthoyl-CoA synthase [Actinomyces bowdenii]|uniref:1,4-dihydroxy-2-naphthoyl-CoA synthase n=1 Tax=Actinomyces bowdenii TaxID=131109 RepID=A0A853ELR8_9ACTO|nr:1,4-dihydroxy-2-naphthoyl-CoA synthase [Actinomyces bowdenii]MBF0697642.1 1,4-dihydroxy-2-naphthoyl-CoA synthase [Actinomyces bowdenii]NYS69815.1 1,4-dihydroxy-2-naphthoyl-CoA synthase [Actinomyces bowdenii]